MQYNMSPETIVSTRTSGVTVDNCLERTRPDSKSPNDCIAANGVHFSKDFRGVLPAVIDGLYAERKQIKKHMLGLQSQVEKGDKGASKMVTKLDTQQMAIKIMMNSLYGGLGNRWFRYYDIRMAEAITMSGQLSIRWISDKTNAYLNKILKTDDVDYVIACDTDSMYLNLGPLVQEVFKGREANDEVIVGFLNKVCNVEFEKFIEGSYQELATYVRAYAQKMKMKRENIASKGIWTAKKRYILNVWDSEGVRYSEPKMKICGMETARSSTPAFFRDKLLKAYTIIINGSNDDVIDFIDEVREETKKQDYQDIAFPRGCNNLDKYSSRHDIYEKGTPIHVRGALLYNWYLKKHKITHKHALIQEGEKIKFLYLKVPNPIMENTISFMGRIPAEFQIEKYIDHKLQFEKSFYEPLKNVLNCIGWDSEKTISLLSFF